MCKKTVQVTFDEKEFKILNELKSTFGEKTDSKAMKSAARNYKRVEADKERYFQELNKLQRKYDLLLDLCENIFDTKEEITEIIAESKKDVFV